MENVDGINGAVDRLDIRPYSEVKRGYTYFENNDVIFSKITPCMQNGKHAVVSGLADGIGFGSTEFHVVRCSEEIIPEWVHFFLRRKETLNDAEKTFTGTVGQQRVPKLFLENLEIPVPKISEQRRITTQLKVQLTEVEKTCNAAQTQLEEIKALDSCYNKELLNELRLVPRVPLGDLLVNIEAGKSIKTTELPAKPDELGILKVSAISWKNFQPQEAKAVAEGYEPDEIHRIRKGDLIISRANTVELVGAVVEVLQDYPLRLLSDKTLRLVVDQKRVNPNYLLNVLRWSEGRTYIEHHATGTSDSMRNISQKTIRSIPVPYVSKTKPNSTEI